MNAIELMTLLNTKTDSLEAMASATHDANIAGGKEIYVAMGKSLNHTNKDIEAAWKATAPVKASRGGAAGFANVYYDWLAAGKREEAEAKGYIMGTGGYGETTKNVKAHLTHYLNIWALAETVRAGAKVERTVSATKGPNDNKTVSSNAAPVVKKAPVITPYKELLAVIKDIATGEYKSKGSAVSVIKGKMGALEDDAHLELAEKAIAMLEEKGKMVDIQPKFIEMMQEL